LTLSPAHWRQMLRHVQNCLPEEACGLIAGKHGIVDTLFIVENELHSPVRFRMKPEDQLKALIWMENHRKDLLGIYHSHPSGPDYPSFTDMAENAYPHVVMLIWSPSLTGWQLHGYKAAGTQYLPVEVVGNTIS